jgi:hypothetical protein
MKIYYKKLRNVAKNTTIEKSLEHEEFQNAGYIGLYGGLKAKKR